MEKYKVCIYAIAKNEEKFVRRWMESAKEADDVYVLDTGSTDRTVALLQELGAHVTQEAITPWRFDVARNRSLALVPEDCDICVCIDLDEFFSPGWRARVEEAWAQGATRVSYRYIWNFLPDGREGTVFWLDKIHARHAYRWRHPVHEVLQYTGDGQQYIVPAQGITVEHHADPGKSRGQYLNLLELSVEEAPHDDRNMHYLGREYMFYGRYEDCIRTLQQHLAMPESVWEAERCASMRYIARACTALGRRDEATRWLLRAVAEAPYLREPYVELAMQFYQEENWPALAAACEAALAIREKPQIYINEPSAWSELPCDLASLAWYRLGQPDRALARGEEALTLAPEDDRIRQNVEFFRSTAKRGADQP